jgi:hypothetical protein
MSSSIHYGPGGDAKLSRYGSSQLQRLTAECLDALLCILNVPGYSIGPESGYTEEFRDFRQSLYANAGLTFHFMTRQFPSSSFRVYQRSINTTEHLNASLEHCRYGNLLGVFMIVTVNGDYFPKQH